MTLVIFNKEMVMWKMLTLGHPHSMSPTSDIFNIHHYHVADILRPVKPFQVTQNSSGHTLGSLLVILCYVKQVIITLNKEILKCLKCIIGLMMGVTLRRNTVNYMLVIVLLNASSTKTNKPQSN